MVEANVVENFLAVPTTLAAMAISTSRGSIEWSLGAALGAGSVLGGLLGSRLTLSEQARRWIVWLLVVMIVGELVQLSTRYVSELIG
ncbi:MAG: TSUP family transporter [Geminicoccaceae bacterium]